jgi:ADP-ribose pyrophosphatase YjhB (NUDIX family)
MMETAVPFDAFLGEREGIPESLEVQEVPKVAAEVSPIKDTMSINTGNTCRDVVIKRACTVRGMYPVFRKQLTAATKEFRNVIAANLKISVETPLAAKETAISFRDERIFIPLGRVKPPPKCEDPIFRAEAMSTVELSKFVFPPICPEAVLCAGNGENDGALHATISCSTCSSAASQDSDDSDEQTTCKDQECSNAIDMMVLDRKTSRQGRETQRWITDEDNNHTTRLVTGCVPILMDGKILFVSASRKSEWILPKGGWEQDETMEESAMRETFEEAGVVGVLGPRLTEVYHETRKSKKRRLEKDNTMIKKDESSRRETESNLSHGTPDYTHVRMTLFPLYISEVKEHWPESGRIRKAVDIDEAIEMLVTRTELHAFLLEVKAKGLHLGPQQN